MQKEKIIVAGPCSAETREQVMETARQLYEGGINIYRAGVWKPRSRPGTFKGVGKEALEWMAEVKSVYGMKIATEINCAANVEYLVKYNVDIAWIGARTSVNPFVVDEIAEAMRGLDMAVYIKNPICPDADLWIGSIERMLNIGIKDVKAIHRGFMQYGRDIYRNVPLWTLPLRVMKEMPEIDMLCDPSHITGKREYVEQVASMAMSLDMDGIFMESHIDPENALSDSRQQLTPADTIEMLERINLL